MSRHGYAGGDSEFEDWAAQHMAEDAARAAGFAGQPVSSAVPMAQSPPSRPAPMPAPVPPTQVLMVPPAVAPQPQLQPRPGRWGRRFLLLFNLLTLAGVGVVGWLLVDPQAKGRVQRWLALPAQPSPGATVQEVESAQARTVEAVSGPLAALREELKEIRAELDRTRKQLDKVRAAPAAKAVLLQLEGWLTTADAKDEVRKECYCKVFPIELIEGRTYQIDLIGVSGLDPYLRLEDADRKELAANDDGGGYPNARIVFRASRTGIHRVIATTYPGGHTGMFILKIQEK